MLFKNENDALHFRSTVYEKVFLFSPNKDLTVTISVDPAVEARLSETILVVHFTRDEDSPPETPRAMSGVTELYDNSNLFKYQRLEHVNYFRSIYKADRAHLIDKGLCDKGQRFSKFYENENNFLALSKEVHAWFDGLHDVKEKIPFFNLAVKDVSPPDPMNEFRHRVTLEIEAYNVDASQLLFRKLKEGSKVIDDTHAETFVYVENPEEFKVCIRWKADKINRLWNFTPAVE